MEYSPQCATCCATCTVSLPRTPQNCIYGGPPGAGQDPFALTNLLAAGTVTIKRAGQEEPALCDHKHTDDGWHIFDGMHHAAYLADIEDVTLCKEIGFLVKHKFIAVTYNTISEDILVLRIYIIPVDLPHVQGRLHQGNRKDNILLPARRYLRDLLPRIRQNHDQWLGVSPATYSQSKPVLYFSPDNRTLAEIYGDLASPQVDPSQACCDIVSRLLNYTDTLKGLGFRTSLYRYQRRSIAAMVTRELDLRLIPDPLYVTGTSMDGRLFHFQPGTMEVLNERGLVAPTRGGILCEELGTGKTVMILGLVLSTLNQLPFPPETIAEPSPIFTPVALRAFPSTPFSFMRQQIYHHEMKESCSRVPSLVELMLHHARVTTDDDPPNRVTPQGIRQYEKNLEIENCLEMTSLGGLLRENVPFYFCYPSVPFNNETRPKRGQNIQTPRIMYLSSATLVVVPPNLLSQWDREIMKHCEYPLRVLILRSGTKLPPVKTLATDYDIILLTYNRYTMEAGFKNVSKLYSLAPCTCPNISNTRVPQCRCQSVDGVSPFLQIRWKRLVIDEGHVSATLSTNLTPFTKMLSVERRWIVTGTPTTNLLGLSFGKNNIEEVVHNPESPDENDDDSWSYTWDSTYDSTPSASARNTPSEQRQSNQSLTGPTGRTWNKYDREDLHKLDNMITHFIAVPHFISNPKLMQTHIREPLFDSKGPRPGSIQALNQVMQVVMIRHQIEDVEQDIVLPPVVHESILLDLDPVVIKSYNALQATIAINAIDSQRTDQDYLFHPRNAEFLQLTVKNMSQLMFWSVDETMYNVDQLARNAQTHIARAIERKMPQSDIWLITEAFKHVKAAAEDPLWRRIQTHEDVPYRVFRMPQKVFHAWTRTTELNPGYHPTLVGLLHADRLLKLRDLLMARPLLNEDIIAERGAEVAQTDSEERKAFEEAYKRNKNRHSRKYTRSLEDRNNEIMVENAAKKAAAPDTLKEMQRELDHSLARLDDDSEDENHLTMSGTDSNTAQALPSVLLKSSVLASTLVGDSASSKLNYIINEVLNHSAKEKFLIFSDSELTLAHISEALELIQVKFLRFTTQIQPQVREQLVLTFETSETYRVFLMELKHGARGLNLISASRVVFCEPVWQADVESQAIKRAHRIGQTRPITVKTLAIRGTAEENMVERRNLLRSGHDKLPKLTEESGMRHYIANPKFITHEPDLLPIVEFPLIKIPQLPPSSPPGITKARIPVSLPASPMPAKRVRVEEPLQENTDRTTNHPAKKIKKAVHFADVS